MSDPHPSVSGRIIVKYGLIGLAIAMNYQLYWSRIAEIDGTLLNLVYFSLFAFCLSAILASALSPNTLTRLAWATLFFIAGVAHDSYVTAVGSFLTYDSFILMYRSFGFVDAAVQQYSGPIQSALPANLMLFIGIVLPPASGQAKNSLAGKIAGIYPFGVLGTLVIVFYARGGAGSNGLPSPVVIPALGALYAVDLLSSEHVSRQEVSIDVRQSGVAPFADIVYIIDESIRGDYLDVNHRYGARSGLAELGSQIKVVNFGLAAAATNCSIGSNLVLRFGGTREKYREQIATSPPVWDYAKKAGLETVYIDAQSEHKFFNGMTDKEIAKIDQIIQFKDVIPRDRDIKAAKSLVGLLNDEKRQFILVNKLGAHFPIHDKYPDSHYLYKPALQRGVLDTSKPITRTIFGDEGTNWKKYKNSYKNTITWSVGHFFDLVLEGADLKGKVIIYTSDHGQNFHERGDPGQHTHCSSAGSPSMEEGVVPLLVLLDGTSPWANPLEVASNENDGQSHYAIFPTLLEFMNYESKPVRRLYGLPLTESHVDPMTFNTKFEARLGQKPVWHKVKPDSIQFPEAEDK